MPAARYVPINLADRATLNSTETFATTLPLTNMQTQGRSTVTRFLNNGGVTIQAQLPSAVPISCVAICGHSLTPVGTVAVELYSNTNVTGLISTTGAVTVYPIGLSPTVENLNFPENAIFRNKAFYFPTAPTVGAVVIRILDSGSALGYNEVARLVIGQYREFKYQDAYGGATLSIDSQTTNERTKDGSQVSDKGSNFTRIDVKKDWIANGSDWADLIAAYTRLGMDGDFFYSQFPSDTTMGLEEFYYQGMKKFGAMSGVDKWVYGLNRTSFTLEGQ